MLRRIYREYKVKMIAINISFIYKLITYSVCNRVEIGTCPNILFAIDSQRHLSRSKQIVKAEFGCHFFSLRSVPTQCWHFDAWSISTYKRNVPPVQVASSTSLCRNVQGLSVCLFGFFVRYLFIANTYKYCDDFLIPFSYLEVVLIV